MLIESDVSAPTRRSVANRMNRPAGAIFAAIIARDVTSIDFGERRNKARESLLPRRLQLHGGVEGGPPREIFSGQIQIDVLAGHP